jgi:hypothetical protein
MDKKEYKKFEDYDMDKVVAAYMRHVAFNTKCAVSGEKLPFAFSEGKDGRVFYNDTAYEHRQMGGGATPKMDTPAPNKELDQLMDF